MRRILGSLLVLITLLAVAPPASAATSVVLDGVSVTLRPLTREVVTVNRTSGWHARVSYYTRTSTGSPWSLRWRTTDGRIGYGGLADPTTRRQGTGTTPLGTVSLISTFGTHAKASGWTMNYRRIRRGDFWVEDNASAYYNRYRNKAAGGFRWWLPVSDDNGSERLSNYPAQYEFLAVTSYNYWAQVRHRGAGIFLHVNGSGATAGCVSIPRALMRKLMWSLRSGSQPVMAVGR